MSGGRFDYAYTHVNVFADQLTEETARETSSETDEELKKVIDRAYAFANTMRAVEWFYSGDISEEEMLERIRENERVFSF